MSVYIIGEAGTYHWGDIKRAYDLVLAAKKAGADCVKFQIWKTDKFVAKTSPFYEKFSRVELPRKAWVEIFEYSRTTGIDFLASAFDIDTVDFLDALGMKAFKIASGDITYEPLLHHIGKKKKPVYLSTGMSTVIEMNQAYQWLAPAKVIFLKCTVNYPCTEDDVNLDGLRTLQNEFRTHENLIGLSDHTKGYLASCMAVAMGATVIEKHFALEETEEAIGAEQFTEWIQHVRQAERIMGSDELKTFPCEEKWKKIARRGEGGMRE